ncbi:hypothetical protein F4553_002944 [Allocatelliglobosispora scoriae]|uniref:Uncharacterized protein n=1 Tax=Allocatelliglobosispora scoriae TaxID=643052 RepID=A0A841BPG0_9ACTN|nr:hypothetical protein [Allocatelliglobosispora scoriae]MBB5869565.1 hypothetical protein [Allocatelliglobosispora scoriae]
MDRNVTRRLFLHGAVLAVLAAPVAVGLATPAAAAPAAAPSAAPNPVNSMTIAGVGLTEPLTIDATDNQREFEAMLSEVDWLAVRPGVSVKSPTAEKLGPKYTVTLLVDGVAKQQYDLYPLATGGPRAYRSDKQPDKRKVAAGWFYGRFTMPTAMRAAGVPLTGVSLPPGAGGGGGGTGATEQEQDISSMFGEWRGVVALNGVVALLIAAGLFGIAFGIRRKI